ncbi:MAG: hypothetical protein P9L90_05890 [Candidatus Aadella gelida]|nr:hypothetical protein [Candidatus Aadella gelida]
MYDLEKIQSYINNFRRHIAPYLKPGIGLSCKVYPVTSAGAILEFTIGPSKNNNDNFESLSETVNDVLERVPQRIVSGNVGTVKFAGTNISMEPNRILVIKGEDKELLWNDQEAQNDVQKIVRAQSRVQI